MFVDLMFAHLNVRSLTANLSQVEGVLKNHNLTILAITETWLTGRVPDDAVNIDGFSLVRFDRCGRGGGAGIYVHNKYSYSRINVDTSVEQCWINLKIGNKFYAIGSVYRPPGSGYAQFLSVLEDTLSLVLPLCDEVVLLGDFNIDMYKRHEPATSSLNSVFQTYGLTQMITDATRISQNSSTLIDLIVISDDPEVCTAGVADAGQCFDHLLVTLNLHLPVAAEYPFLKTYRDFRGVNPELLLHDLRSLCLSDIYYINNIDDKLRFFNSNILMLYNIHVPERSVKITRPRAPWVTPTLSSMFKLRDRALRKFQLSGRIQDRNYYKSLRNYINGAVKREKRAYINYQFRQGTRKKFWKNLNELSISSNRRTATLPDPLCRPNDINDFFINSPDFGNPDRDIIHFYSTNRHENVNDQFCLSPVLPEEIQSIINNISTNSVGSDGICISFIKLCCPHLLPVITHIINSCIIDNTFPSCWKEAIVIPIAKVREPTEFKDLRPVSILPALSKVLEKIVDRQLRDFLSQNNLLPDRQSGFRPGFSSTSTLLDITDDILAATDKGNLSLAILLDFTKAFDTVNHEILLAIFHYLGFAPGCIEFFSSYLSDRFQLVKIKNSVSSKLNLRAGVAQGSILGPLLYIIYTSNFHNTFQFCSFHSYADDTQLYCSFPSHDLPGACREINQELATFVDISRKFCLKINPNKSSVVLFGSRNTVTRVQNLININILNTPIPLVTFARNLGLMIDSDLRFHQHIDKKIQSAFIALKKLYANKQILSPNIRKLLCDSLVLSQFNYGDVIYGPCLTSVTVQRIQRVQNACLRFIYGLRKYDHISHTLVRAGWLNMHDRRKLHMGVFFFRVLKFSTPPYLHKKIRYRTDVHNLNLRHRNSITLPRYATTMYRRSFTYSLAAFWNALPCRLRRLELSVRGFRVRLRRWILGGQVDCL